jgi:hypothetical protein
VPSSSSSISAHALAPSCAAPSESRT